MNGARKVPVILDTDIGTDIDDTWALGYLLKSPGLDLKLVTTASGDTTCRARIVAKFLETAGHDDVPIGIGIQSGQHPGPQAAWAYDYDLRDYAGAIHDDAIQAMIDVVSSSKDPVTVASIGPLTNVAAALHASPAMAKHARLVGMLGSIRTGYGGKPPQVAEYNVVQDPTACRVVLDAPWDTTITPLDTCGVVVLDGKRYQVVHDSTDPIAVAIMENYECWSMGRRDIDPEHASSVLFDTVAVHLASSTAFLDMERFGLRVTPDGYTVPDAGAKESCCAMSWTDRDGFLSLLSSRLEG